jgi:hypothetical protein
MRLLALLVLLTACPGPSKKPAPDMQRTTSDNTCEDVAWSCVGMTPGTETAWGCTEGNASQLSQYQTSCTAEKNGRFALTPCMRDNVIGGCTVARGSTCTTTWYASPATRATVENDCVKLSALFVAP